MASSINDIRFAGLNKLMQGQDRVMRAYVMS